jgi:hypothetical protein
MKVAWNADQDARGSSRRDGSSVCSEGKDPDPILVDAVARAEKGQVDADLWWRRH